MRWRRFSPNGIMIYPYSILFYVAFLIKAVAAAVALTTSMCSERTRLQLHYHGFTRVFTM